MKKKFYVLTAIFTVTITSPICAGKAQFTFTNVVEQAQLLASRPYTPASDGNVLKLTYDEYRNIRFDNSKSVFADTDSPFRMQLFPTGYYFTRPITLYRVDNGNVSEIKAQKSSFINTSGKELPDSVSIPLSGFRVSTHLNSSKIWDEFLVFQGASYFRAVPKSGAYGLSARGLVIQPHDEKTEEFPDFTTFWILTPNKNDKTLEIYALLESESATGAYKFIVTPGEETKIDVCAKVFAREELNGVGIAPLTSMFYFNESNHFAIDDFRAASHDSDGFAANLKSGECIWRQLRNPRNVEYSSFTNEIPQSFGLYQRERNSIGYQDFETNYEARPSAWIIPGKNFPKGSADLLEIPTPDDTNDNIVSFWKAQEKVQKEKPLEFDYTLVFSTHETKSNLLRTISSRSGLPTYGKKNYRLFVVDFAADKKPKQIQIEDITADVSSSSGTIKNARIEKNPVTGGVRLCFELHDYIGTNPELRARILKKNKQISETWLYRWGE